MEQSERFLLMVVKFGFWVFGRAQTSGLRSLVTGHWSLITEQTTSIRPQTNLFYEDYGLWAASLPQRGAPQRIVPATGSYNVHR
jgi:hypothetical protein